MDDDAQAGAAGGRNKIAHGLVPVVIGPRNSFAPLSPAQATRSNCRFILCVTSPTAHRAGLAGAFHNRGIAMANSAQSAPFVFERRKSALQVDVKQQDGAAASVQKIGHAACVAVMITVTFV